MVGIIIELYTDMNLLDMSMEHPWVRYVSSATAHAAAAAFTPAAAALALAALAAGTFAASALATAVAGWRRSHAFRTALNVSKLFCEHYTSNVPTLTSLYIPTYSR